MFTTEERQERGTLLFISNGGSIPASAEVSDRKPRLS